MIDKCTLAGGKKILSQLEKPTRNSDAIQMAKEFLDCIYRNKKRTSEKLYLLAYEISKKIKEEDRAKELWGGYIEKYKNRLKDEGYENGTIELLIELKQIKQIENKLDKIKSSPYAGEQQKKEAKKIEKDIEEIKTEIKELKKHSNENKKEIVSKISEESRRISDMLSKIDKSVNELLYFSETYKNILEQLRSASAEQKEQLELQREILRKIPMDTVKQISPMLEKGFKGVEKQASELALEIIDIVPSKTMIEVLKYLKPLMEKNKTQILLSINKIIEIVPSKTTTEVLDALEPIIEKNNQEQLSAISEIGRKIGYMNSHIIKILQSLPKEILEVAIEHPEIVADDHVISAIVRNKKLTGAITNYDVKMNCKDFKEKVSRFGKAKQCAVSFWEDKQSKMISARIIGPNTDFALRIEFIPNKSSFFKRISERKTGESNITFYLWWAEKIEIELIRAELSKIFGIRGDSSWTAI